MNEETREEEGTNTELALDLLVDECANKCAADVAAVGGGDEGAELEGGELLLDV